MRANNNAASCWIDHRELFPYRPFFFLQMREGGKGIIEHKRRLAFTLPLIVAAISYSSSRHVALSTRSILPRSARFQPSGLASSTALHLYNSKPIKDQANWTRLIHLFVISARTWGMYPRYSSVTFSLRLLSLPGQKIESGKCHNLPVCPYARIYFGIRMRDIEGAYFQWKKENLVLGLHTRTYFFPPDRYRSVGQKTSK